MQIRFGFELDYELVQPTPMMLTITTHHSRTPDLVEGDVLTTFPQVPVQGYRDSFGNWCTRLVGPPGGFTLRSTGIVRDTGLADPVHPDACQHPVEDLPDDCLIFLLGSRYCETDKLTEIAWSLFGKTTPGWPRVQAICDYVNRHITFGYEHASPTKTAMDAYEQRVGVCRDFAHLAIAFCRCMNIPARYCSGYLTDIGIPPPYGTMDFAGWFEAWLGGAWHTFDPRNNEPRIGRILIARGRDATDVAISNTFGPNTLRAFTVWADEIPAPPA